MVSLQKRTKITFMVGISGSGKTSLATTLLKEPKTLRINRDDLRRVLIKDLNSDYFRRKDLVKLETIVSRAAECLYKEAANYGYKNVILDNTNLTQAFIRDWIAVAEDFEFILVDCDPALAEARVCFRDYGYDIETVTEAFKQEKLAYIYRQAKQYEEIKKWILMAYPQKIKK